MRNGVLVPRTSATVPTTTRTGIAGLLATPRYEIIPAAAAEAAVVANVPTDVRISITASPTKGLEPTVDVATRLARAGYQAVPHLSARLIADDVHLAELIVRLRTAGVTEVFVPAGDADPPAGEFVGALDVLTRLTAMGSPFEEVGITGYPESHPMIADDVTVQAMWDKRAHATYIVSNLCFDPAVLARWVARVRARGINLPIQVGVTGPVERAKLLAMATKIGVGESTRFLGKHPGMFKRFAGPNGFSPERYLQRVVDALDRQGTPPAGLHIYTFNQVAGTERWRRRMLGSADR
ncbi:MAG: 5,10-methylenetetrahydrofolate reductase [Streptosporangiales bacterium]|nr:5,10-methylenetetrahydrofolate reductase [Streptosporangiales bacterium]